MQIIRQLLKVIKNKCPKLFEQMAHITDPRKRRDYQVAELVTGGIMMFLLKETSRNGFNNEMCDQFKRNYYQILKLRLPHMDTVDVFLRALPPFELEALKAALVSGLIEQKVLHRFRILGRYFMIAIDGTGVASYSENDKEKSRIHKKSKNGVVTYSHYVLEAKLVTSSGLAISVATEWVANEPLRSFNKQDCEQRAFERLAPKLKKYFPRLPICLLADGLYPNKTFFSLCKRNDWEFVVVLKDESLKTLQQDIKDVENKHHHSIITVDKSNKGKTHIERTYKWVAEPLLHAKHTVNWLSCKETITEKDADPVTTNFVYLSSININKSNVRNVAHAARMRWKIENEGFNTQKNGGYNLGHKYTRSTLDCLKNYYQCMQIAHLINQLIEHSKNIADILAANRKLTIKHLWKDLICVLKMVIINENDIKIDDRGQVRLDG